MDQIEVSSIANNKEDLRILKHKKKGEDRYGILPLISILINLIEQTR